ncbi:MAG: hypothetical protein WBG30_10505 [Psychrilyobacter sp.]|uniref:hypothetical protein n=1 Tax=Psychrilyobacter sp. TaxID=2586924 RepID=UPI003C77ADF9
MVKRRKKIIFFLENIFYFTLIIVVFRNILGYQEQFLELNIHPLLILVGIMAYRYGVHLGVISATIATFVYIYSYLELGNDLVVFFYDFKYYKFILMFYTTSFILGRIRDNQKEKLNELSGEILVLHKNYKSLYKNNTKIIYLNNRMKDQIIKAEESIIALHGIATTLDTLDVEEILTNLIGVFKTYINAEVLSLYDVDSSKKYMRLKVAVGENRKLPSSIEISKYPKFEKIIREKKYGKRDGEDLDVPVFYAPILKDGEVIGVLNIERLSYESYTTYTEKLFEILVSWTSKSISNAMSYSEKIKDEIFYEKTLIMREEFFKKRVEEEKKRSEMFELSYILLKFKVLVEDLKKIKLNVRSVDKVGYSKETKLLYIIFPATKLENIEMLKVKILEKNLGILEEYHED